MNGLTTRAAVCACALAAAALVATAPQARAHDGHAHAPLAAPAPLVWSAQAPSPVERFEAQGAAMGGRLYVFGGYDGDYVPSTDSISGTTRADVFDPAAGPRGAWSEVEEMPQQLTHAPVVVHGRSLYLFGGFVGDHPGPSVANVWRFDPDGGDPDGDGRPGTWHAMPPLPEPRGAAGAAIVGSQVHVFGGVQRRYVDEAEHWTLDLAAPGAGWQARAPLPEARNHVAGVGFAGRVYAIGGQFGDDEPDGNRATVEIYDPATGRWSPGPALPAPRGHMTSSVFVAGDRILAVGGTENNPPGGTSFGVRSRAVTELGLEGGWVELMPLPDGRKTPVADHVGDRIVSATGADPGPSTTTWTAPYAQPPLPGTPGGPTPSPAPPAPAPGSGTEAAGGGTAGRASVRVTRTRLRVAGASVALRLSCAAPTRGRVSLRGRLRGGPVRTLARTTFRCDEGAATVRVRLSRTDRRRLRRQGRARVVVVVTTDAGLKSRRSALLRPA